MTLAGHFIYASFIDYGMRIIQSSNVDQLLRETSLRFLYDLGKRHAFNVSNPDAGEYLELINTFGTERIVAYSYLTPVHDNHGRQSVWNHTILVRYNDVIPYDKLFTKYLETVKPYFIEPLKEPPSKLKALRIM